MSCLEIGPGANPLEGYDTLDVLGDTTYRAEWGRDELPIKNEIYDSVYSSHCIEHVPWYRTDFAFSEVFRILKPGGTVEIHTVDFALVVKAYLSGKTLDKWTCHGRNANLDPMKWVASRLFAYQKGETEEMWHRALFDEAYLRDCLAKAGFERIERCEPPINHHGIINLGLRGIKPKRVAA